MLESLSVDCVQGVGILHGCPRTIRRQSAVSVKTTSHASGAGKRIMRSAELRSTARYAMPVRLILKNRSHVTSAAGCHRGLVASPVWGMDFGYVPNVLVPPTALAKLVVVIGSYREARMEGCCVGFVWKRGRCRVQSVESRCLLDMGNDVKGVIGRSCWKNVLRWTALLFHCR